MRSPNFSLKWLITNKLIGLTHFHPEVTKEDVMNLFKEIEKMLGAVKEEFSLIIDNRVVPMERLYTLAELQEQAPYLAHQYLKYVVVVKPNHLEITDEDMREQESKGVLLKNVSTVSEALHVLESYQAIAPGSFNESDFFPA